MKRPLSGFLSVYGLALFFCCLLSLFSASPALAATTTGHAWSENTGYIDFSQVTVEDSALSGYAYSPNIGWLSLNCANTSSCGTVDYKVTNDNGTLSGYAWSENTGYIDFGNVTISNAGVFSGYAYSPNIGWLSLNCANTSSCGTVDYSVTTTWRPTSHTSHSGGGGSSSNYATTTVVLTSPLIETPAQTLARLQTLLAQLIAELKALKAQEGGTAPTQLLTRDLEWGSVGTDVITLQHLLITANKGPQARTLARRTPTGFFGLLTRAAVIEYQQAMGITPALGYVGSKTRATFTTPLATP